MSYRIGIDVGGTFTDFLVIDEYGKSEVFKTLTVPHSPTDGVFEGLKKIAQSKHISQDELLAQVTHIIHGATITTNAVITEKGARTAFITTRGFRDMLMMRRGIKSDNQYDYTVPQLSPLIPRHRTFEVTERVDYQGEELIPLAENEVREIAAFLQTQSIEAVALSYLWSFNNPGHEQRTAQILREELPDAYISISSEIIPQIRVYERNSTTALNAYVGPILARYLSTLQQRLEAGGFAGTLLIMQSNGGVMSPELTSRFAVNTLFSGPAGGPEAGIFYGKLQHIDNLITIDMGGTSFDVALVEKGKPITTTEEEIVGHRVALPTLDIHTIGAGGGSIAYIDKSGLLAVGPQSAGADPGPVCYGRGGSEPTVTDADLLLGYLDPDFFAGGEIKLNVEAARQAMRTKIAEPLNLTVEAAAEGVYWLVNTNMASAVRFVSIERGKDPREFALVVAGGAGPIHAGAIAHELEIPLVIIPRESSVFCAAGMLMSNVKHDYVRTFTRVMSDDTINEANALLSEMATQAQETLLSEGIREQDIVIRASVDMRYIGQFHEVEVGTDGSLLSAEALAQEFHKEHDALFGHSVPGAPVEMINVRIRSEGITSKPTFEMRPDMGSDSKHALKTHRQAYFSGGKYATPVYDGLLLHHGNSVAAPAIIEQPTTTIVVPPGYQMICDQYENYIVHPENQHLSDILHNLSYAEAIAVGGY